MSLSNRYVIGSAFAFLLTGFLALLCIVVMTSWLQERSQAIFEGAVAARDVRGAAVELRSALQTAESSQRGFIASGNEIYLAPYATAKSSGERQLALLKQLFARQGGTQRPRSTG